MKIIEIGNQTRSDIFIMLGLIFFSTNHPNCGTWAIVTSFSLYLLDRMYNKNE